LETHDSLLNHAKEYLRHVLNDTAPDSVLAVAWDEFYKMYDDVIRRFTISRGVPYSQLDDCAQEVWSDVMRRLTLFDRPADRPGLRSWLYTIVRSKVEDIFRKTNRFTTVQEDQPEPLGSAADPAALYEKNWESQLLLSLLEQMKSELSPTNHAVLKLRLVDGKSVQETASELGIKPEQVRYGYHRAKLKLQSAISLVMGEPIGSTKKSL
jgi:RNA polymerase sigma factor (sigma-70 family)